MKIEISHVMFLAFFLFIYGGFHAYLYVKLQRTLRMRGPVRLILVLVLLFMTGSPVFVHWVASLEIPRLTSSAACVAYLWMGGLFLFFCIHLVFDVGSFAIVLGKYRQEKLSKWILLDRRMFPFALALTAGIMLHGWFEAKNVRLTKLVFNTDNLPEGSKRLRVAQISDLHFGILDRMEVAHHVREMIDREKPDLLVCTGDFVDRGLHCGNPVIHIFAEMNPPGGKFAIPGNHEFYAGIDESARIMKEAGFVFLRNRVVTTNQGIRIAGVDDPAARRMGKDALVSEKALLDGLDGPVLTILLKHQPRIDVSSKDRFDIQLSGHTHNGQIFPFGLITRLFYPYTRGLYDVGDRSRLYVSRGTGTWGPPIRVLAPPEITIIDFVKNR